jgi:hypothetical protein
VEQDGLRAVARRDRVQALDGLTGLAGMPLPGSPVSVRRESGSFVRMPGFYVVTSDRGPAVDGDARRCYLNLTARSAPDLLADLLAALRSQPVPYTLKTVVTAGQFARSDNTVLYYSIKDEETVLCAVLDTCERHSDALGSRTPLFANRLRAGVAVADEPPTESGLRRSFGEHRCRLVARTLVIHSLQGCTGGCDVTALLVEAFRAAGLDPDHRKQDPRTPPSDPIRGGEPDEGEPRGPGEYAVDGAGHPVHPTGDSQGHA